MDTFFESNSLDDTTKEILVASTAMEQLPKVLHALSNIARRSRLQLHRKGVCLGGVWRNEDVFSKERSKGILKTKGKKTATRLLAYNDMWRTYQFSPPDTYRKQTWESTADFKWDTSLTNFQPKRYLQSGVYESNALSICGEKPSLNNSDEAFIRRVIINHAKYGVFQDKERELLVQLYYLKMLADIPLHKLLRGKPREYVLPLPRRATRGALSATPHSKALKAYQCVKDLPRTGSKTKWFNFGSSNAYKFQYTEYADDAELVAAMKSKNLPKHGKVRYGTTVPKGIAFITYPDSIEETNFEDTIGGRRLISWEKGTRFPQMGIDQSTEFKIRREQSRQQMLQRRLRAARVQRRLTYSPYLNAPTKRKGRCHRVKKMFSKSTFRRQLRRARSSCQSWFRSIRFGKPVRLIWKRNVVTSGVIAVPEGGEMINTDVDVVVKGVIKTRKTAERTKERKRLRLIFTTFLNCLSCGIISYVTTGEYRIFRRKRRVSTIESRENFLCNNENE